MWSIRRILVPTDFSGASEAAFDAAIALAQKHDAAVVLMHAYDVPRPSNSDGPHVRLEEVAAHLRNTAQAALSAAASAKGGAVPISTSLRVGRPWEQILKAAEEHQVSLVFIGSRGLRGAARAFLGSTAAQVVRFADVPVLTFVDNGRNPP